MNKTKPFLLLASSLTLLGCSQIGSDSNSIEAPAGSEVGKEIVTAHYAKAIESMNDTKAVGANLVGNAGFDISNESANTANGVTERYSSSTSLSVSDIDASVAMNVGDEAKMSMKASANYSYSSNVTGSVASSDSNVSKSGKASVSAYLSDNTLYADMTGLSSFLAISVSSENTSLKRKTTVNVESVDWNDCADCLDKLAEQASKSEYLQVKEGTYSFVYTIDPNKFTSSSSVVSAKNNWTGEFKAWLSFTEEGFTEAGISGNVKYENAYSFAQSDGSYSYESSLKIEISANLKASFSYGSNVKVEEVADPDSYVETNANVD